MTTKLLKFRTLFVSLILGLALTATIPVKAQTTIASGGAGGVEAALKTELSGAALSTITNLKVTGDIDARDFRFIRDSLGASLTALDLGGCDIVAYSGTDGTNLTTATGPMANQPGTLNVATNYGADTVPVYALYARWITKAGSFPFGAAEYGEMNLSKLTSLVLPSSAVYIDNNALAKLTIEKIDLSSLTALTGIGNYVFLNATSAKIILPATPTFTYMGGRPFQNCSNIDTIIIPNTITTLFNQVNFVEGCTALKAVIFESPCQLTALPLRMFAGTNEALTPASLTYVKLPASVTEIGTIENNTFTGFMGSYIDCDPANTKYESINGALYLKADNTLITLPKGLATFTIPSTMTVIPANMFANMTKLTQVTVESVLTEIGDNAFLNTSITSFTFPASLVKIGSSAFKGSKLKSADLSNCSALATIGGNTFEGMDSLTDVNLSGLTFTSPQMFNANANLTTVTLGSVMKKIGTKTFALCSKLASISIPNTVDSIMDGAFQGCKALAAANLPTSLKYLGGYAFGETAITGTMTVPASCVSMGFTNNLGCPFAQTCININVDAGNPVYSSIDGMLLNKAENKLIYMPNSATSGKAVAIPEGIDTVLKYAFQTNADSNIVKVTLPSTLKVVADNGLTGIKNAEALVSNAKTPPVLGSSALGGYSATNNLKQITVPTGTKAAYLAANGWKDYPESFYLMTPSFTDLGVGMAMAVSPNGKYIAGSYMNQGYIYNLETGIRTVIPDAYDARDVNDSGDAALMINDNEYMSGHANGGVYRKGKVYSVGFGRFGEIPTDAGPAIDLYAIDSSSNVYGATYNLKSYAVIAPFKWQYNEGNDDYITDTVQFSTPQIAGDQGAKITSISKDGQVAGGWISRKIYGGQRVSIFWPNPDETKILDQTNSSSGGAHVSPNGKYLIQKYDNRAAIYDIANDKLTVFGPEGSDPTSVSDNGFVVGFHHIGTGSTGSRTGFVYSDKLGYKTLREFIDEYLPEIEIPEEDFFQFSGAMLDVPMDISKDGLVITGWSGASAINSKGWSIQIPTALDLIDRPHNLTATVDVPKRNHVNLSWTKPDSSSQTPDRYMIYRNGELIDSTNAFDGTTYTDINAPTDKVSYQVSVLYNANNANRIESAKTTDPAEVTIIDNYNIPFAENFESNSYASNYWTAETQITEAWILSRGFINGMRDAIFTASGGGQPYKLSLTSKPFNAEAKEKVILAFNHAVILDPASVLGAPDTISIEIGFGNEWTSIEKIIVKTRIPWTSVTKDISNVAAGKLFQIRFRASSGLTPYGNKTPYNYALDNLGIAFESTSEATDVIAYRTDSNTNTPVHVMYKDVTGSYGLSYSNGATGGWTAGRGVVGESIIAANRFTYNELVKMRGKYLTSISAYLVADNVPSSPTEIKLAVFDGDDRIENSAVGEWKGNAWNNFPLSTPIQITEQMDELLIGIEAVCANPANAPISMTFASFELDTINKTFIFYEVVPNGNMFFETGTDEGWRNAHEASNYNYGIVFPGQWDIVANIRDENAAATPDDDLFTVGYEIYRGDTKLEELKYGQFFIDTASTSNDDCYTVKVFRMLGGMSPMSEEGCVEIINGGGTSIDPVAVTERIYVYPNPTSDIVTITTECKMVRVFNMSGKMVMQANGKSVNMRSLPSGIYVIEATTTQGRVATAKVIKR